jgi:hypothetical protein
MIKIVLDLLNHLYQTEELKKYYNSMLTNKLIRKLLTSASVQENMTGYKRRKMMNDSSERYSYCGGRKNTMMTCVSLPEEKYFLLAFLCLGI